MARLLSIWCSVLAVAAFASGKAIDVTKDLQSDESQVLPLTLLGLPGLSSVASSLAFSKSASQSSSKSESHSGSHSFSKTGSYTFGQDGIPQQASHSYSASNSQSSSNSGKSSSSESASHSFSHNGALGIPLTLSEVSSQAASNSEHQSASDSSSHSAVVHSGPGLLQSFSQSGSQASSESGLQSSSHSFSNSGTVGVGPGAVQAFGQSASQASSKSALQSSSDSSSHSFSNSAADLGAGHSFIQSGSQAASNSDHLASSQSSSNAFINSGALDAGLGGIEHFSQSGSEASSNSSLSSSSNSFANSGALDTSVGAIQSGSGQQASSGSSSQAYSGSTGALGSSQSYSGSESTSSSSSGQQGASTNLDTSGISGGVLASLAQNQETSTPSSILATGTLDSQVQTSGLNDDASYTQIILPHGANYDSQNSILDSTYIRSGIGQESQDEISQSGAQISHHGFGQTASLTPFLQVSDTGSGSLPVTNQGNRDSLVILSYHGGNEQQSTAHQENAGNSASYGTNYVLIGGRHVVPEKPKVSPCHVCSGGGIEHITNIGQLQDSAVVQAPISTSYQTIVRPSDVPYETSVLNANDQHDNQDRSRVIVHSTYHSLHPYGTYSGSQNQDRTISRGFTNPTSYSTGNLNAYNTYQAGDQHDIAIDRLNQFYGSNSPSYASFETQNVQVPTLITDINKGSTNNDNVVLIGNQSGGKHAGHTSISPTLLPAVENNKWTLEELIRSFNATPTVTTVSQESVPVPAGSSESTITAFSGDYLPPVQTSVPVILPGSTSAASSHSSASSQSQQSSSSSHSSSSSSSGSISTVPVITPGANYLTPIETLGNLPVSHSGDGGISIVQFDVPQSFSSSQSTSSGDTSGSSQKSSSSSNSFTSGETLAGSGSISSSQASSSSGSAGGSLSPLSSSGSISTVPVITPGASYLTPIETLGNLPVSHSGDGGISILQFDVPQSFSSSQSTSSGDVSGSSQKSSSSSNSFSSGESLGGSGSVSSSQASSSSGSVGGSLSSVSSSQSSTFNRGSENSHHLVPSFGGVQPPIVAIGQQEANHGIVQGSTNSYQASSSDGNSGHLQYIVPVFGSTGDHVSLGNAAHGVVDSTSSTYGGSSGNPQQSSGSVSTSSSSSGASGSHSSSDSSSTSGNTGSSFFGKVKTFFKRIPTYFKSSSSSHSSSQSQSSSSSASSHSYSSSSALS